MYIANQYDNTKEEMVKQILDSMGIHETRRTGNGKMKSDNTVLLYTPVVTKFNMPDGLAL